MNEKIILAVIATLAFGNCECVMANHTGIPMPSLYVAFDLPAVPPDNVYEVFFASDPAAGHRKHITGGGTFYNTSATQPASAIVWIAWRDTFDSLTTHLSDPSYVEMLPGEQGFLTKFVTIPYCPPLVGIRIQNDSPAGQSIAATGQVIHHTIPIPEPGGLALAAAGALGVAGVAKRRQGSTGS